MNAVVYDCEIIKGMQSEGYSENQEKGKWKRMKKKIHRGWGEAENWKKKKTDSVEERMIQ